MDRPEPAATAVARAPSLARCLADKPFAVTAEVIPPLAADLRALLERVEPLRGLVDAINVTDAAGARTAMSAYAAGAVLAIAGWEPVLQIACRDRNRIALAGDVLGAAAQGVRSVLVLHGDDPAAGDQPDAKPVYDLDTRAALALIAEMNAGKTPSGRAIDPPPDLLPGAADTPFDPPPGWRPDRLRAKADAGARFVQTQFCYDAAVVRRYLQRLADDGLGERLSVLIGVGPIASARSARWMNRHLYGVHVPDGLIERLERAADPAAEGIRLCAALIDDLRAVPGVAGVHLMAPAGGSAAIAAVLETLNLDR